MAIKKGTHIKRNAWSCGSTAAAVDAARTRDGKEHAAAILEAMEKTRVGSRLDVRLRSINGQTERTICMEVVGTFQDFAVMETPRGTRECYRWDDVVLIRDGKPVYTEALL